MTTHLTIRSTVARRLLDERKRLGWTLEQLAARASVSRGMISKIERGESDPSAALLARLADAMELGLSDLMREPSEVRPAVSRLAEQASWIDPATKYLRRVVWPTRGPGEVEVVAVELPPGQSARFAASRVRGATEQVMLLQGHLTINTDEERLLLQPGDCALFRTDQAHAFINDGSEASRYLVLRSDNGSPSQPASPASTQE